MNQYDLVANVYDLVTNNYDYNTWTKVFLDAANFEKSSSLEVLDIGVGTGKMAYEFLKRGHRVFGIDNSIEMIEIAAKKNPELELVLHDMRIPREFGAFDLIVLSDDVINHCLSEDEVFEVFKLIKLNMGNNGRAVMDINTLHGYMETFSQTRLMEFPGCDVVWNGNLKMNETKTSCMAELKLYLYTLNDKNVSKSVLKIDQAHFPQEVLRKIANMTGLEMRCLEITSGGVLREIENEPLSNKYLITLRNKVFALD